uniref:URB1 C-terminal domain-containing protein n=1 Tax=Kalanchoe fedtschenkoi TaxID=63787 RepID=A0A7N0UWV8_KALFE
MISVCLLLADMSPTFSPLVPCIFQKCLRLLNSESGTFTYAGKSMIALYVCNTIKYILQTQVDAKLFAAWIDLVLSKGVEYSSHANNESTIFSEWRPVRDLWNFAKSVSMFDACKLFDADMNDMHIDPLFVSTLNEVKKILGVGKIRELGSVTTEGLCASTICTSSNEILMNFPTTVEVLGALLGVPLSFLSSIFFLDGSLLVRVLKSWPDIFAPALQSVTSDFREKETKSGICEVSAPPPLADGTPYNPPTDSITSPDAIFGMILDMVPFHVVYPLFMSADGLQLMDQFKLNDWFLFKVSKCPFDLLVPTLRIVLFWFYQVQSYFRTNPSDELVRLSEICFVVIENLLDQVWVVKGEYQHSASLQVLLSKRFLPEIAESIFCHPSVINSLEFMLGEGEILTKKVCGDIWTDFLFSGKDLNDADVWISAFEVDHFSLRILRKGSGKLLSFYDDSPCVHEDNANLRNLLKKYDVIRERLLMGLKKRIEMGIQSSDLAQLVSVIRVFRALKQLIPPSELLVLAHWMLNRVSKKDLSYLRSRRSDVHVVCFHIASDIFETLARYWDQPKSEGMAYWQIHGMDKVFNVQLFEGVYFKVRDMAPWVKLEIADICLLKAIKVIYMLHSKPCQKILPMSLALSRAVASTPVELVSHCIQGVTKTKAKLLFFLTELSPLHLSVFGNIFLEITNKLVLLKGNATEGYPCAISSEQLLMLLPTVLTYINWSLMKFGKEHIAHLTSVLSIYSGVLLKGFANWNSYVSGCLFQEDYSEFLSFSCQDLLHLCFNSLLGKAVIMLQYSCTSADSSITLKRRMKLFDSVCNHSPGQNELLGCDISVLESYSSSQLTNFLNDVMSKTLFCKLMLFPECFHGQSSEREEDGKGKDNTKNKSSRLQFVNMLMNTWCLIVSASASSFAKSGESNSGTNLLFKQFEVFILTTFVESVEKTCDSIIQLHSLPFLEQFFRTSLLYRFEDSTTLKMLRTVLTSLSEGTYLSDLFLQLLLSHSHFISTLQMGFISTEHGHAGVFAGQVSSILRAVVFTNDVDDKTEAVMSDLVLRKLEVIKLLRLLFHLSFRKRGRDSEKHLEINLRELFVLLLSSYGATLSEVDLEIYRLMNDMECNDGVDSGNMSEVDYMWGRAALTVKQNQKHEILAPNSTNDEETKEWRRTQFRENVQFDPKLCLVTILNFPHKRKAPTAEIDASEFNIDKLEEENKVHVQNAVDIKGYDPVFILRFSIHILSMGYVEPLEFAGLGLLPMAFVSISSPDEGIRKLGYETLGRFQNALEKSQNRKDVMRLRLLLTCVQNGIEEPLQQIPSVIAIFAAEASMILLEASNNHYSDIVELLTSFSALKMKRIPLFDKFFWSSSLNFKIERVWILRLCYTGLRLKEDAQIYIRSSVLENILSYYSSPFADDDSKLLILQILNKAIKLHRTTRHLVENCSLLPWLSHRVSNFSEELDGERKTLFTGHLILVCQVVREIVSSRNFAEWLQNQSLEQLSELSCQLFRLLINGEALFREHVDLVNSILQIVTATAKISQKRNIYQAHFTLSFDGLFQMYKTISLSGCNSTAEFALKAVLMSTPPVAVIQMHQEKLSEFVMWAISTAASSDSTQVTPHSICDPHFTLQSVELREDSLKSKLLRWLTASVILAKVSGLAKKGTHSNFDTPDCVSLEPLLESVRHVQDLTENSSGSEETLAVTIFYLHQLLRHNCRVTPSVMAALCILLFPTSISTAGSEPISPVDYGIHVAPLVSKIRSPPEANLKWRWTYYQPWEDRTATRSDSEKLEESEACERLVGTILNVLQRRPLDSQNLCSYTDLTDVPVT